MSKRDHSGGLRRELGPVAVMLFTAGMMVIRSLLHRAVLHRRAR